MLIEKKHRLDCNHVINRLFRSDKDCGRAVFLIFLKSEDRWNEKAQNPNGPDIPTSLGDRALCLFKSTLVLFVPPPRVRRPQQRPRFIKGFPVFNGTYCAS